MNRKLEKQIYVFNQTKLDMNALKTYDIELLHDPMVSFHGESEELFDTAVLDLSGNKLKAPVSNAILNALKARSWKFSQSTKIF